uniref:Ribonuclease L n=1 Tax=Sphenodon punctatus TaxID=8508 RepID=A0A8D0G9F4_SPHPU
MVEGGWTPLHTAVKAEEEGAVHFLLEKGANPHARKENGATPFIVAGIAGKVSLLKLFLSHGSEINEYDDNGFTAFMEAAWHGKEEALRFLHKSGADVNLRRIVNEEKRAINRGGATALMDAARKGHLSIVKTLVREMEADVNLCDNQDRNALVHAFLETHCKDRESVVHFLLDCGADVNRRNEDGKTTLILAVEREQGCKNPITCLHLASMLSCLVSGILQLWIPSPIASPGLVSILLYLTIELFIYFCNPERESLDLVMAVLEKDEVDINDTGMDGKTALMIAVEKNNYEIAKLLCENKARTDVGDLIGLARRNYNAKMETLLRQYNARTIPYQPLKHWEPTSRRWAKPLQALYRKDRPMIGKLKLFTHTNFRIQRTSQGGIYLGFYDGKEVAVKIFLAAKNNNEPEKLCLEECSSNNHLIKLYGKEKNKACLYLCLSLCEKNLEEYLSAAENEGVKSKDILKTIFLAVQELHWFGYGHQDLHPSNILIDIAGKVFLADFDKSRKLDESQKDLLIGEDLKVISI